MRLRENQQRARIAKVWIYISMGISLLSFFYIPYVYSIIERGNNYTATREEIMTMGVVSLFFGLVAIGAFIGSAITFIQWFRRAYFNAHIVFQGMRYSEGWAAGAWFIPIFWWIGPFQIASDFFKKTEARLKEEGVVKGKSKFHVVALWWGFWVASSLFNQIDDTLGVEPDVELIFGLIAAVASIISGVFVIRFISVYSKMEKDLMRLELEGQESVVSDNPDLLD
jgi:hypothetical protein